MAAIVRKTGFLGGLLAYAPIAVRSDAKASLLSL